MAIRRIGQILVDLGYISDEQLDILLEEQRHSPGMLLGQLAVKSDLVTQEQLAQALAEQLNMQVVSIGEMKIPPEVIEKITESMAALYRVVPIKFDEAENTLWVATCDPQNISVQDELRTFLGHEVKLLVATEQDIENTIKHYYSEDEESIEGIIKDLNEDEQLKKKSLELSGGGQSHNITDDLESMANSAPVRKLLNMVLLVAIRDHASDIHFEPFEDEFRIRIKADGVLYEMVPPPRHLAFAITTRIKVMANLDIAERRLPQDGRIELVVGGHPVDLRVSVLPTMFGESVVLRVLDRSVVSLDLEKVGLDPDLLAGFREVIKKPNGIVLVTGPTGSGKTTTLYSALNELNCIEDKLITTEEPVEYDLDGIVQIPIDAEIGNTFAFCLRSILRQDPDKILVGEIRDTETAEIAVQASLTGHLVFSTLHTNDAPSTITRLKDMGVPAFMITATVEAILAQRLVRRICSRCREAVPPDEDLMYELQLTKKDVEGKSFYEGKGCESCNGTGYRGRVGVFELMIITNELREMIMENASNDKVRQVLRGYGVKSLRDSAIEMLFDGVTTAEEVVRETIMEL